MSAIGIVERYFAAWNRHDTEALLSLFAQDGTYSDPMTKGKIAGAPLVAHARALWGAFPDLSFELISTLETRRVVAAE